MAGSEWSSLKRSSPRQRVQLPTTRRACAAVGPNHSNPHSVQVTLAFPSLINPTIGPTRPPADGTFVQFWQLVHTAPVTSSGRRLAHGRSASIWDANESSSSSPIGGPTSWIDVGSPSSPWKSGSEIAGCPVTFHTAV